MRKNVGILLILLLLFQCFHAVIVQALPKLNLQLTYDNKVHTYSEEQFFVTINGETVQSDPPPIILFDCTMIPARAFFEMLNYEVEWDHANRKVHIDYNNTSITLTIDSVLAQVNGQTSSMIMPAKIINDRTFIPLRFVSEKLGFTVKWDGVKRIASVQTPVVASPSPAVPSIEPSPTIKIPDISVKEITTKSFDNVFRVIISADEPMKDVDSFLLNSSENPRYVIDINDAAFPAKSFSKEINNGYVKSIRASQYNGNTVRVVLDLQDKNYSIWQPTGKKNIYIDFDTSVAKPTISPSPIPSVSPSINPNVNSSQTLDPKAADKLVVIDAGHGGSDVGAVATYKGKEIYEKDITLAISLQVNEILKKAGVKTYMIRSVDKAVELYQRPEIANALNADLFVSIHCNSFTSDEAYGTETHYDGNDQSEKYGINSKQMAQIMQNELMKKLSTTDRGLKNGSDLVVLRKTNMPSVLVETAFMSNPDDLELLMDNSFRQKIAQAIANGIIRSLNQSVK